MVQKGCAWRKRWCNDSLNTCLNSRLKLPSCLKAWVQFSPPRVNHTLPLWQGWLNSRKFAQKFRFDNQSHSKLQPLASHESVWYIVSKRTRAKQRPTSKLSRAWASENMLLKRFPWILQFNTVQISSKIAAGKYHLNLELPKKPFHRNFGWIQRKFYSRRLY